MITGNPIEGLVVPVRSAIAPGGAQGIEGAIGERGERGETGEQGLEGPKGERGYPGGPPPVGSIFVYAGKRAPDGYFICDGAWYEIERYPELFAVVEHDFTYVVDDVSHPLTDWFCIPDLRARIPIGIGPLDNDVSFKFELGEKRGTHQHVLVESEMPSHFHTVENHLHSVDINHNHSVGINEHGHPDPTHAHYLAAPIHYSNLINQAAGPWSWLFTNGFGYFWFNTTQGAYTGLYNVGNMGGWTNYVSEQLANWHIRNTDGRAPNTNSKGSGVAHNNVQPGLGVNYIVKY